MRFIIILTALCAALTGCEGAISMPRLNTDIEREPIFYDEPEPEAEPVVAITPHEPVREEYTVFVESPSYRLATYEPANGIYLGAYILSNPAIDYSIHRFESAAGKAHAMYSYYTSLGGDIPASWLLDCISKQKTPNIIVKFPKLEIDEEALEDCAKQIGEFNVPIFVHIAPVEKGFEPDKYKRFFSQARKVFAEHAPNAAIVWTVKAENAFDCMKFYPGDENVDWVGISLYQTITSDKEYDPGVFTAFEHFYYTFQKTKPIMLTEFAVSHQTNIDSVYRTTLAADEISRVYTELPQKFPRVKAVVYMDVNTINTTSQRETRDNFSLLEQREILMAYSRAVERSDYISRIIESRDANQVAQLMRSPFAAYSIDDEMFISRATIEQDMNIRGASSRLKVETIDEREYFFASELSAAGVGRMFINSQEDTIVIKR